MAIISFSSTPSKNLTSTATLDKDELYALAPISGDAFWSDPTNIKQVAIVYRSTIGNQTKIVIFDAQQESPQADITFSSDARDNFVLSIITLKDYDNGQLELRRDDLSSLITTSDYDLDLGSVTVTLSTDAVSAEIGVPFSVTATFSSSVTGFVAADVTATTGSIYNFSGSGTTYTFEVVPASGSSISVSVGQDVVVGANTASNTLTLSVSAASAITVALSSQFTGSTADAPIDVTANFSSDALGFSQSDIQVTNGTISNFQYVVGFRYIKMAGKDGWNSTGSNTPASYIGLSDVTFRWGDANKNMSSIGASITYLNSPTGTGNLINGTVEASNNTDLRYWPVSASFTDLFVIDLKSIYQVQAILLGPQAGYNFPKTFKVYGSVDNSTWVEILSVAQVTNDWVAGSYRTFNTAAVAADEATFTVTPTVVAGVTTIRIPQNCLDTPNRASPTLAYTYREKATVSVSTNETIAFINSPVEVNVEFSEPVTGFSLADIIVTGGTAADLIGTGSSYSFHVTPQGGNLTEVRVSADTVLTANGARNQVSNTLQIEVNELIGDDASNSVMFLSPSGTAYSIGDNNYGQLGTNTVDVSTVTAQVLGSKIFKDIGTGATLSQPLATITCNVTNGSKNITNISSSVTLVPGMILAQTNGRLFKILSVSGTTAALDLAFGFTQSNQPLTLHGRSTFAAGLASDGLVYTWGANDYNQLGDGTAANRSSPSAITGKSFRKLTVGSGMAVALDNNGLAWSWGQADSGGLGSGVQNASIAPLTSVSSPILVVGDRLFSKIIGDFSSFGIEASTGKLYAWGQNAYGQLGDGTTTNRSSPVSVLGGRSYSDVAYSSNGSTLALEGSTGFLWSCGLNSQGMSGDGTVANRSSPVSVLGGRSYSYITASKNTFFAIEGSTGRAYAWGRDYNGHAGMGFYNTAVNSPASVTGGRSFKKILSGGQVSVSPGFQTFALEGSTGYLYGWGDNSYAFLGDNTSIYRSSPTAVAGARSYSDFMFNNTDNVNNTFKVLALEGSTGNLYSWGQNAYGQLGDGTTSGRSSPVSVLGGRSYSKIAEISSSELTSFSAAIEGSTGYVLTWGLNTSGQLGNNSIANRSSPVSVLGGRSYSKLFSSSNAMVALEASTGNLYSWGANGAGQLGDGTANNRSSPVSVLTGRSYNNLSTSVDARHTFIAYGNNPYSWGRNDYGQLGAALLINASSPVSVLGGRSYTKISAGINYVAAIELDTNVAYAWGYNNLGQLGNNNSVDTNSPVSVVGGRSWKDISTSGGVHNDNYLGFPLTYISHTVAIEYSTGKLYAWGYNNIGQLGESSGQHRSSPVSVSSGRSFTSVTVGPNFSAAIEGSTGNIYAWGLNTSGQLGDGSYTNRNTPVSVLGSRSYSKIVAFEKGIAAIEASTNDIYVTGQLSSLDWGGTKYKTTHTSPEYSVSGNRSYSAMFSGSDTIYAVEASTGNLYAWGLNDNGKLGDNTATARISPVSVVGGRSYSTIGIDLNGGIYAFVNAIEASTGRIWGWGYNGNRQLGDNTTSNRSSPVSLLGGRSYTKTVNGHSVGYSANLAIEGSTGIIYAWGHDGNGTWGLFGDNATGATRSSPVAVAGGRSYSDVALSYGGSMALEASTGYIYTWGTNDYGILGDGTSAKRSSPTAVLGARSYSAICNSGHLGGNGCASAVEGSTGYVWSWGRNDYGQLGDGTVTWRSSPVAVAGGRSYSKLVRGFLGSAAIEASTGRIWTWGQNTKGEIGDNTATNRSSPVSVAGGRSYKDLVVLGSQNYAALEASTGHVYIWGSNSYGQLGDGTTSNRSSPTKVLGNRSYSRIDHQISSGESTYVSAIEGSTGYIWAWGSITNGMLGIDAEMPVRSPVKLKNITEL